MTRRPPPWCSPPRRRPELRSPTLTERRDAAAADEPGRSGSAGTAARTTPEAKAPHPTGLCRASSNITTIDHPGKAADSPAFADLSCTDDDAAGDDGADGEGRRAPGGRPTVAHRATPSSGPASPTTPGARGTTPTATTQPRSPARPAMGPPRTPTPRTAVGRASTGRTADPPPSDAAGRQEQVLPVEHGPAGAAVVPRGERGEVVVERGDPLGVARDVAVRGDRRTVDGLPEVPPRLGRRVSRRRSRVRRRATTSVTRSPSRARTWSSSPHSGGGWAPGGGGGA